ncbi:MAG: prolyl oligopeptidase family serine peptidase [Balneolaceae bacterium]
MMKLRQQLILATLFIFAAAEWSAAQTTDFTIPADSERLTLESIFLEPVIPGIRPSLRSFSPDGSAIYYSWNDSSYFDTGIYSLSLSGGEPEPLEETPPRVVHSPDNRRIAYTKDGDLYLSHTDGTGEQRIVASQSSEFNPQWSPNGRMLAFMRDGDVWVTHTTRPEIVQVTRRGNNGPSFTLRGWAGNERLIVSQTDNSDARTIYFPTYADEFVTPGTTRRGIPHVTFFTAHLDGSPLDTLSAGVQRTSPAATHSGNYILLDYSDAALKERRVHLFDTRNDSESILFDDQTEGWLHGTALRTAPRTDRAFLLSEQSGWNHLYLLDFPRQQVTQITSGEYEITWADWVDDQTIVYANNQADYGERHLFLYDLQSDSHRQLTADEAYRYQFSLSPDRSTLVYAKTYFNEPYDLFMIDLANPGEELQLTHSVPDRFHDHYWQTEQYVRFTGRDGETGLAMSVLYPEDYNPERQYPVVVFAHGAGSLQNVYKGWSNNYWREYMFHQYLTYHDYIVVEVDFRHSTGYGRAFREDVTDWMGRYETEDIVDGLDWLQEHTGGALDLGRVGIYGGSYGGFMALYALTAEPERFHAGAALRKVTNWRNYYYANPWYTLPRLGDPDEVPEHYDRSSPLTYADELQHPVILLHGLIDDNVGFQDAVQYAEALIQSRHENFEMMMYPTERHGFTSPNSWYDEYLRIFNFFEKHLK